MTTIGILSEGPTDYRVIKQVLLGFFEEDEEHIYINACFPTCKRKTLMAEGPRSPSLRAFLDELSERSIEICEGSGGPVSSRATSS